MKRLKINDSYDPSLSLNYVKKLITYLPQITATDRSRNKKFLI